MDFKPVYIIGWFNMPWILYVLLLAILILLSILIFNKDIREPKVLFYMIAALTMICLFEIPCMCLYINEIHNLKSGNVYVVEGKIEKFIPANQNAKGIEEIKIQGNIFEYSSAIIKGGLNHSIADQVQENTYVRISYRGGTILEVEKQIE